MSPSTARRASLLVGAAGHRETIRPQQIRMHSSQRQSRPRAPGVNSTSRSLIAHAQGDDTLAWRRLVDLYSPLVHCWCRWQRVPEQDVPDVLQDVFQAVSVNLPKFRNDRPQDTFRGWLRTITRHKVSDHFRRADEAYVAGGTDAQRWLAQFPAAGSNGSSRHSTADGERCATQAVYRRALALVREHFEERTWRAFWAVVVDGRPTRDVADELGMQPGTVRVAKCRVLQRLRQELGDVGD